jgi:hypothetical protein
LFTHPSYHEDLPEECKQEHQGIPRKIKCCEKLAREWFRNEDCTKISRIYVYDYAVLVVYLMIITASSCSERTATQRFELE